MERKVDLRGLEFNIELLDIQQLNTRLLQGSFDIAKASFSAAIDLADRYWVLPSGSALGFGVGPLLLASNAGTIPRNSQQVTLCPGQHTTASLLFNLFYDQTTRVQHSVFSDIMPALVEKTADFGVCIHEGRFTWQAQGLHLIEDLGTRWETATGKPLPLGGILASRKLDAKIVRQVQAVIYDSLHYAAKHQEEALSTMRAHAQEFDDSVLMQHVALYVNDWTFDLGDEGAAALAELSARALARSSSINELVCEPKHLEVFDL